ncbi:hypothetical protein [Bacillus sp. Marseille-P3661]|uniref:hypothetical protein n=1 Tax=Bacillus sp. Marseille-P3661 TaxID=1936234 RepID=UPI000C844809|nr:hypothetical protein [Bacillus sp. Marseille-P3661]
MLAATHMLAGATVYKVTSHKKAIGLPLAFGSHFGLDCIHHYDLNINGNLIIGVPIILFILLMGWKQKDGVLIIAAFLGMLPDLISILKISDSFHQIHMFLHFKPSYPLPPYLLVIEGLLAILFITYLIKKWDMK